MFVFVFFFFFFFSSRRRHTRWTGDWSSDVCSSDLLRLINAMLMPSQGQVLVQGRSTVEWDLIRLRRGLDTLYKRQDCFRILRWRKMWGWSRHWKIGAAAARQRA